MSEEWKPFETMGVNQALLLDDECGDYVHSNDSIECAARRALADEVRRLRAEVDENECAYTALAGHATRVRAERDEVVASCAAIKMAVQDLAKAMMEKVNDESESGPVLMLEARELAQTMSKALASIQNEKEKP